MFLSNFSSRSKAQMPDKSARFPDRQVSGYFTRFAVIGVHLRDDAIQRNITRFDYALVR